MAREPQHCASLLRPQRNHGAYLPMSWVMCLCFSTYLLGHYSPRPDMQALPRSPQLATADGAQVGRTVGAHPVVRRAAARRITPTGSLRPIAVC